MMNLNILPKNLFLCIRESSTNPTSRTRLLVIILLSTLNTSKKSLKGIKSRLKYLWRISIPLGCVWTKYLWRDFWREIPSQIQFLCKFHLIFIFPQQLPPKILDPNTDLIQLCPQNQQKWYSEKRELRMTNQKQNLRATKPPRFRSNRSSSWTRQRRLRR